MLRIHIRSPEEPPRVEALSDGEHVIGRHSSADLRLASKRISRRHAMLKIDGREAVLTDLGSQNGTWVNGQRVVGPKRVLAGDRIRLGDFALRIEAEEGHVPWAEDNDLSSLAPSHKASLVEGMRVETEGVVRDAFTANPILDRLKEIGAIVEGAEVSVPAGRSALDPLSLFSTVTELINSAPSTEAFLDEILGLVCMVAGADAGAVVLLEGDDLTPLCVRRLTKASEEEGVPISRTIVNTAVSERAVVTTHDASQDERFEQQQSIALMGLRSVLCAPLIRQDEVPGVLYLTRPPGGFGREEQMSVAAVAHLAGMGLERSRLHEQMEKEERLRRALSRFHAPDVVDAVIAQDATEGGPVSKLTPAEATVLFCDICGFTSVAEGVDAETLGEMLNEFYHAMTEAVFEQGGTVDKYIGDCVMALFGVPVSKGNDALRAVEAAVQMQLRFEKIDAWASRGARLRIGVNTGPLVAGTVGSALRLEYTALGDAVNVAQRLESVAQPGQILAGPITAAAVQNAYHLHSKSMMNVKGRKAPVEVFEILGRKARHQREGSGEGQSVKTAISRIPDAD
ncbi:MAG: adenylate/guanylate cyclase domain-containing protein [Deltaproteobacteria bacterium]|nr:adenylate/guanylate cyclase domain-containing protein [Deltaproteobacteria bacterium]